MTNHVRMYGIPNCDTIKKAKKWLEAKGIDYQFVNFKTEGVDPDNAQQWIDHAGLDTVINKRGTTWRKLSPEQQDISNDEEAIRLICAEPSLIKRPVLVTDQTIRIGFKPEIYADLFS